jgi:hypothetical protein
MNSHRSLTPEILEKWKKSAAAVGIPKEAYNPEVRIIKDESGKSKYTFGAILNSYRSKRPMNPTECPLCDVAEERLKDPHRRIVSENELPGFVVIPNLFPIVQGVSIAIDQGFGEKERNMYNTNNLNSLTSELEAIFKFSNKTGFKAFHNSEGAGASIARHEHWHLTNYGAIYDRAGDSYGFDKADQSTVLRGISTIDGFDFAHLVFDQKDPERITHFLRKLGERIGNNYSNGNVPHIIAQGEKGILISPTKNFRDKGIGSGDVAGHIVYKDEKDFLNADYKECSRKLGERLFAKEDINLKTFL